MLVSTPSKSSPFVSVINQYGQPLMPCSPRKARLLLKEGKAKVLKKSPFQIKLLYGCSGYRQPMVAGLDTGTKTLGNAEVTFLGNANPFFGGGSFSSTSERIAIAPSRTR